MSQPDETDQTDAETHVHAGPHDEGGGGGMATRELKAREEADDD